MEATRGEWVELLVVVWRVEVLEVEREVKREEEWREVAAERQVVLEAVSMEDCNTSDFPTRSIGSRIPSRD